MQIFKLKDDWQSFPEGGVCVIRYGAFGDMIQTSSVFPALKEQGHKVTVNTTERGAEILRGNPYVDTVITQATNQVPNEDLSKYWAHLSKFYRVINLSESVERSLLAIKSDKSWNWHKDFRDLVMGVDYLDGTHAIAGVLEYPKRPAFYPTKRETKWARDYRLKLGKKNKVIMWALSGSSVHKAYPHTDTVVARLMLTKPDVRVVFVGDELCQIIDGAWKNEKRVTRKSGKWTIRQTLAFLKECDLVVGPETGVMNAASYEKTYKVLMLSHSSKKNIGGSWPSTTVLEPTVDCFPCHKLHYGWASCNRDEATGGAACAANISPDSVYDAICEAI